MGRTIRTTRFAEEHIIGLLKEQDSGAKTADGLPQALHLLGDLLRFKAQYDGMDVSDTGRLNAVGEEIRG